MLCSIGYCIRTGSCYKKMAAGTRLLRLQRAMVPVIVLCCFYSYLATTIAVFLAVLLFRVTKVKVFISKHEATGKDRAENVSNALKGRGYDVWLSQWETQKDVESMQRGVDDCDVLLLIATPGIFHKDRNWVTHTEVKYAIDSGKAIVILDGGIRYCNKLPTCGHIDECCKDVRPDFQPYARMIVKALERLKWHGDIEYRSVDLDKIEQQINHREQTVKKMMRYLSLEMKEGCCNYRLSSGNGEIKQYKQLRSHQTSLLHIHIHKSSGVFCSTNNSISSFVFLF
jgi:hypothetical protein